VDHAASQPSNKHDARIRIHNAMFIILDVVEYSSQMDLIDVMGV